MIILRHILKENKFMDNQMNLNSCINQLTILHVFFIYLNYFIKIKAYFQLMKLIYYFYLD